MTGTVIQGLVTVNDQDYNPTAWQGLLLVAVNVAVMYAVNVWGSRVFPFLQNLLLVFHVMSFFAVLIPLWVVPEHNFTQVAFMQYTNYSGYKTRGLSLMVGQMSAVWALCGESES